METWEDPPLEEFVQNNRRRHLAVGAVIAAVVLGVGALAFLTSDTRRIASLEGDARAAIADARWAQAVTLADEVLALASVEFQSDEDAERRRALACEAHVGLGVQRLDDREYSEARAAFRSAIKHCPRGAADSPTNRMVDSFLAQAVAQTEAEDLIAAADTYVAAAQFVRDHPGLKSREAEVERAQRMASRSVAERAEKAGQWRVAGDAWLRAGALDKAEVSFTKVAAWDQLARVRWKPRRYEEAGDLYVKAGLWGQAAQTFTYADVPAKAKLAFEQQGDASTEKGDWVDAASAYAKAEAPRKEASAHLHNGRVRRAAGLFEEAEAWKEAADAWAVLARSDPDLAVRQNAARAYGKAEDPLADRYWDEALAVAEEFSAWDSVVSIYAESGRLGEGVRKLTDAVTALQNSGEVQEAAWVIAALLQHLEANPDARNGLDRALVTRLIAVLESMREALAGFPEVVEIRAFNEYTTFGGPVEIFNLTAVTGTIKNTSERTIRRVTIRILLFEKDEKGFAKADTSTLDDKVWTKFKYAKAGYQHTIVVADIAPGASKPFYASLGNVVPYRRFDHLMGGLEFDEGAAQE